ncbi:hypothetical protein CW304_32835 [Bacillus sp. UFRGS-B20]|nr:hypothetical protein CW304_32835 [Bacillus sp. UFRGS-B20]
MAPNSERPRHPVLLRLSRRRYDSRRRICISPRLLALCIRAGGLILHIDTGHPGLTSMPVRCLMYFAQTHFYRALNSGV